MSGIFIELQDKLVTIALLYARIIPIFLIVPVLNSSVISNMMIRNSIIMAIIIGIWPAIDTTLLAAHYELIDLLFLTLKEVLVGVSLSFILALPFWVFNAIGAFIDVARGSSMGSLLDPTSGQESTELQNFINFCVCAMYLELGGVRLILSTLVQSFHSIGLTQTASIQLEPIAPFVGHVFESGFALASPVLLALLLTEGLLGLFARFTPQLSPFSVSMTIKSVIAVSILSLYFFQIAPDRIIDMMRDYSDQSFLLGKDLK